MIHIYCGDGKGKTTAAVGLCVRALGAGKTVLFSQFLKDGTSSEVSILRSLPRCTVMTCQTVPGFFKFLTPAQQAQVRSDSTALLQTVLAAAPAADLLVLDEVLPACRHGVVPEAVLADFLQHKPAGLEVVLTGRDPSAQLAALADYHTEMKKLKHPYDAGLAARLGVEY